MKLNEKDKWEWCIETCLGAKPGKLQFIQISSVVELVYPIDSNTAVRVVIPHCCFAENVKEMY